MTTHIEAEFGVFPKHFMVLRKFIDYNNTPEYQLRIVGHNPSYTGLTGSLFGESAKTWFVLTASEYNRIKDLLLKD